LDLTYYPLQKKENSEKMNGVVIVTFHNQDVCGVFFVFAVLGFELGALSCKAGTLPLESLQQPKDSSSTTYWLYDLI
jgi:hypothetical protein